MAKIETKMAQNILSLKIARDANDRVTHLDVGARPPRRKWRDGPPTDEMIARFESFYGLSVGRLRHSQVSAMLAYGSFGTSCAERLLSQQTADTQRIFLRLIAAFIAGRREIAKDVIRHEVASDAVGRRNHDVRASRHFDLIAAFCRQACASLSEGGLALSHVSLRSVGTAQSANG